MSRNFRLSCLVTMATILLSSCVSLTSARHLDRSSRSHSGRISKRDVYMGLELLCKLHPRNCPGGIIPKRGGSILETLPLLYPSAGYNKRPPTVDESDRLTSLRAYEANTRPTLSSVDDRSLGKQLLKYLMSDNSPRYERQEDW